MLVLNRKQTRNLLQQLSALSLMINDGHALVSPRLRECTPIPFYKWFRMDGRIVLAVVEFSGLGYLEQNAGCLAMGQEVWGLPERVTTTFSIGRSNSESMFFRFSSSLKTTAFEKNIIRTLFSNNCREKTVYSNLQGCLILTS